MGYLTSTVALKERTRVYRNDGVVQMMEMLSGKMQ